MFDLFTKPETRADKPKDPKEYLKGSVSVSNEVLEDYFLGRLFARAEGGGKRMVWKHGSPYLYPPDEFNQLQTIILAEFAAEEFNRRLIRNTPADIAAALNIPQAEKDKAKKLSQGMADFFKGPLT